MAFSVVVELSRPVGSWERLREATLAQVRLPSGVEVFPIPSGLVGEAPDALGLAVRLTQPPVPWEEVEQVLRGLCEVGQVILYDLQTGAPATPGQLRATYLDA